MKLLLPIWALLVQVDGQYVVSDCRWGSYSPWSECEGCNHTQSRWRGVAAFAQFGGRPCTGARVEVRPCETTRGCPVEEGCGDHFRCPSGQCISRHLLCNGDEDCEGDGADESGCGDRTLACDIDQIPPQAELTGNGYDSIRGEFRRPVINTKYFGGTCHKVYNGDNRRTYRLPHSLLQYTFQVQVKNDFKFRMYESSWSFMKSETGHSEASGKATFSSYSDKRDHFTSASNQKTKAQMYLTVENEVEVAQFISSRPAGLQLTSSFHRALQLLPAVYDQSAYRRLIEDYGTHYLRRGSLGGSYRMLYMVDKDRFSDTEISKEKRHRCSNTNINFFIVKYYDSDCGNYENAMRNAVGGSTGLAKGLSNTVGGRPGFVAALSFINVKDVQGNAAVYARWAGSVTENPVIIKTKLGPLDELVKGVACAGVKRAHLQRALEEYQAEMEPCHCRACANGGRALVMGTSCHCFCQPNTYGPTCQSGALVQQPEGGRGEDGRWSCWSGWSGCRGGQRQRARRCDNPAPSPGGRGCTGNALQHQACPDLQMQHLRTVEPHCFEQGETPIRGCTDPPPMQNGYVQGLQQEFAAGTHAIYRCDAGYYLSGGDGTVRCGDDLRWEDTSLRCLRTVCGPPELGPGVSASPSQPSYSIGQQVTLSCPPHMALHGPARITCDSGLNWDHPLTQVRCDAVPTVKSRPLVPCPAWKKMVGSACVCKMPYECSASVPVCAMEQVSERRLLLTWCKLRSLQCLGKRFTLVHDSECPPSPTHTPSKRLCGRCSPWETCDGSQGGCVCRAGGECVEPGIEFCVLPQGSDVERTVSECQAGVWRCQGQAFTPTAPWPCPGPSPTRAPWP